MRKKVTQNCCHHVFSIHSASKMCWRPGLQETKGKEKENGKKGEGVGKRKGRDEMGDEGGKERVGEGDGRE